MAEENETKVIKMDANKEINLDQAKEISVVSEEVESNSEKENFNEVRDDVSQHYDPNAFGYKPKERVPFTGNIILMLMGLLNAVRIDGTEVVYTPTDSFDETVKSGKETLTELALQATRAMELIQQDHMQNIDEGYATHQDELMKLMAKEQAAQPKQEG